MLTIVEAQVVQPKDLRPVTFLVKYKNLKYDLTDVPEFVLRRYGPNNDIKEEMLTTSSLLEVPVGTDGKLILHPDNDYWPEIEGLYRFGLVITDPVDTTKTWFVPSDPRKMPELQLLTPTRMV